MENPQHILAWAESSREHYDRLIGLSHYPRTGGFEGEAAGIAFTLARATYRAAKHCGDCYEYTSADILDAAKLMLEWQPETFNCEACGREESKCSADPCPAVLADREAEQ